MPKESSTRRTTVRKVLGSAGVISTVQKKENVNKSRHRTPENDVQNRGKHIDGWAFDPNWVKELRGGRSDAYLNAVQRADEGNTRARKEEGPSCDGAGKLSAVAIVHVRVLAPCS